MKNNCRKIWNRAKNFVSLHHTKDRKTYRYSKYRWFYKPYAYVHVRVIILNIYTVFTVSVCITYRVKDLYMASNDCLHTE